MFGLWEANTVNHDDIEVYAESGETLATLHHIRQQIQKPGASEELTSLADFVAPKESDITDHIGAFAVTTGIGADELAAEYEAVTMTTMRLWSKPWPTVWPKPLPSTS